MTFSSNILLIRSNLERVQFQYNQAAVPATSGLRINKLSDEPLSISRLFSLRSLTIDNEQYQRNIDSANSMVNYIDSRLTQGADVLQRVREIAVKSIDSSVNSSLRTQLGQQVDDLKEEFLSLANGTLDGRYVFSGTLFNTEPFTGEPTTFNGNSNSTQLQITPSLNISTNIDSNKYFMGQITEATGSTLATAARASGGINLGLAAGDVITMAADVTGAFTATMTVTETTTLADVASFMQTNIRANGAGTEAVSIQPDGALRVTAGAQQIDDLTLSVPDKDFFNEAFTYPTTIAAAGTGDSDALITGVGEDLFDVFDDLSSSIVEGDPDVISQNLARLDTAIAQIMSGRAEMGIRMQQLSAVETAIQEDSLRYVEELSNIQDANLDEALSDLVSRETALRLVFASSSKVLQATSSLQLNV